jgi:hypothetical protein
MLMIWMWEMSANTCVQVNMMWVRLLEAGGMLVIVIGTDEAMSSSLLSNEFCRVTD